MAVASVQWLRKSFVNGRWFDPSPFHKCSGCDLTQ